MTKDENRKILEDGKFLYYDVWWYSKLTMSCHMGCCDNHFKDVDEALEYLEAACGGNWENVRETF